MSAAGLSALEASRASLRLCAGCHDRCLSATGEVVVSGDQSLALSRLAGMLLRVVDGADWSAGAAAGLFHGAADDSQDEVCIHRVSGHSPWPWMVAGRAKAIRTGVAPEVIGRAIASIREHGNLWGHPEKVPPAEAPTIGDGRGAALGTGGTGGSSDPGAILLHEAITRRESPGSPGSQRLLLERCGLTVRELPVVSTGAVELELGLLEEAERAARETLARLEAAGPGTVVSADPHSVWMLRQGIELLGINAVEHARPAGGGTGRQVEHLAAVLWRHLDPGGTAGTVAIDRDDGSIGVRQGAGSVVYHDAGLLARRSGLVAEPRLLLGLAPGIVIHEARTHGRTARSEGGAPAALGDALAMEVARMRHAELLASGADRVLTASPVALAALRAAGGPTAAADLFEFLDTHLSEGRRP